jgi:hypothetical protein
MDKFDILILGISPSLQLHVMGNHINKITARKEVHRKLGCAVSKNANLRHEIAAFTWPAFYIQPEGQA